MNMVGDEPPYLQVGTEVSAKYKGAFCEAKVRKVDRVVKCRVSFKQGFGLHTVLDTQIKGVLRLNGEVEARHPEKKELVEGIITKIQDCSQYTVVFDDGDITTLRRSALCLKSGRHFAESETLDQLPLTHPEHFGNPVVGGRRGGRRRLGEDSSGEEEPTRKERFKEEREEAIGKVVCVVLGDKKKLKDNWFPGLVVAPNAQDTVRIRVKEEYLVRSFKDGRYYTVPKKDATQFTREIALKVDNNSLKPAVEKALVFLDKDELPPHWDRDLLFGLLTCETSDSEAELDSESSDDEPREEKDHFVAQLYKFMDDRGTPINSCPSVCSRDLDLYKLFKVVHKMNGYNRVSNQNQWKTVASKLAFGPSAGVITQVKHAYKKYLHSFEDFNRKLGCTMVNHPRGGRSRNRGGRSLIRDKDRSAPVEGGVPKAEDGKELVPEESTPVAEAKRPTKEEEPTPRLKPADEVKVKEEPTTSEETDKTRPTSSSRKKFPTLKASPRTKEDTQPLKRRAEVRLVSIKSKRSAGESATADEATPEASRSVMKTPSVRSKRVARDNSVDEARGSDEEPPRPQSRAVSARAKRGARENSVDEARGSEDESAKAAKVQEDQTPKSTTRSKMREEAKTVKKEAPEAKRAKPSKSSDVEGSKRTKSTTSEDSKKSDADKKVKKPTAEDASKRNRKRRNTDAASEEPRTRPCLPRSKSVLIGDILKVYYGSSGDPNGIYEAKVVDIDGDESGQQMFLVHYAGWNSRYDEWVKRNKIAENLSWNPKRAKTTPVKSAKTTATKRKTVITKPDHARSSTPSSITSSSSRTKSPATPVSIGNRRSTRRDRPPADVCPPRRTRRLSGHTDASIDSGSEAASESEDLESENETQPEKAASEEGDERKKEGKKPEAKTPTRRKPAKKLLDEPPSTSEVVERKKPRLIKAEEKERGEAGEVAMTTDIKDEPADTDSPKGRDFDLDEIRSELKGFDKAIKAATEPVIREAAVSETEVEEGEVFVLDYKTGELDCRLQTKAQEVEVELEKADVVVHFEASVTEGTKPEVVIVKDEPPVTDLETPSQPPEDRFSPLDIKEDIYEFKEPEPFEFQEVRRPIRIFDEIIERSPEKSIAVKKVNVGSSPMRATFEKGSSTENEVKSRFRKTIGKKMREAGAAEKKHGDTEPKVEEEANDSLTDVDDPPPVLQPAPPDHSPSTEEYKGAVGPPSPHKMSPEPPCLVAVNEAAPCRPPEQSPVLTREDPPRLDSDLSSSDSESDERLVIANDEESTWSDQPTNLPVAPKEEEEDDEDDKADVKAEQSSPDTRLNRDEERAASLSPNIDESDKSSESNNATKSEPNSPTPPILVDEESDETKQEADDGQQSMRSLVCDEVIPGSPAPKEPAEELQFQPPGGASGSNAAVVMDNTPPTTPPTTPESNMSSPREDRVGSSSLDNESSKSHRESPEGDLDNEGPRSRITKYGKRAEKEPPESPTKKKRRSRKRSESASDVSKKGPMRGSSSRVHKGRGDASDSDDSENSVGPHSSDPLINSRSPRPSKYNFYYKDLAPDLDANQRITFLQHQITEIRKAYMHLKSQLSSIDRRRKKLRRNYREEREKAAAAAAAMALAAAAPCSKVPEESST